MIDNHHAWQVSTEQARELQSEFAKKITINALPENISTIAGFDVAYQKKQDLLIGGMVALTYPELKLLESHYIIDKIKFPYVPGYLSFREAPALLRIIQLYAQDIDVLIFDGHGKAHPRGLGIASHIGVLTGKVTIGCAKKKLVGTFQTPGGSKGAWSNLVYKDTIVARVLRTRQNVKPVFVSVGHKANLEQALVLILNCCTKYRLPEPTRLAHNLVTAAKNTLN